MNLYIETENGAPKNHPAFEDNLLEAFGAIPEHWEPFVRVPRPVPGVDEVLDSDVPTYEKINGTWTDVWVLRGQNFPKETIFLLGCLMRKPLHMTPQPRAQQTEK